jgi:AraC-like DNA-binding protein
VLAFLLLILFSNPVFYIVYYYISVGCSLYVVYMELFERVISKSPGHALSTLKMNRTGETTSPDDEEGAGTKESRLIGRLENYLNSTMAWRNPDLSLNTLALELMTNRTSLGNTLRECGHENYNLYVNRLRTEDFIYQIESGAIKNYQDAFFLAGFRSRSTALRNFRQFTGTTPTEYFRTKGIQVEEDGL